MIPETAGHSVQRGPTRVEDIIRNGQTKPKVPAGEISEAADHRSSRFQSQRPVLDHTKGDGKWLKAMQPNGPDLVKGIALVDLRDGGKLIGHCGDEQVLLVRRGTEVFAVSPNARTTAGRWPMVSWSMIPSVVHGITLASICAQAKLCALPLSVRSRAGRWNSGMARYS